MNFRFFLMGQSWIGADWFMSKDDFAFWLPTYSDELEDFRGQILTDGSNVIIPGSVMEEIIEQCSDFKNVANQFDVYAQTGSGVANQLSPFEF